MASLEHEPSTPTVQINSDSIHLFMFDLINLMSSNFIQNNTMSTTKKTNQQLLLEKIIDKLTSNIDLPSLLGGSATNLSTRRTSNMLLNLTRNKLSLMALCAQFVEPNDLTLFNEFYMKILASISSILLNETNGYFLIRMPDPHHQNNRMHLCQRCTDRTTPSGGSGRLIGSGID